MRDAPQKENDHEYMATESVQPQQAYVHANIGTRSVPQPASVCGVPTRVLRVRHCGKFLKL